MDVPITQHNGDFSTLYTKRDIIKAAETKNISELIEEFDLQESKIKEVLSEKDKILDAIIEDAINLKRSRSKSPNLSTKRDIIKAAETKNISELIEKFGLKSSIIRKILDKKEEILDKIIEDAIELKKARLTTEETTNNKITQEDMLRTWLNALKEDLPPIVYDNAETSESATTSQPTISTPHPSIRKSRKLTLGEKKEIIEAAEIENPSDIVKRYGLKKSTYYDILRLKDKIMKALDDGKAPDRLRIKPPKYLSLENELLTWIKNAKAGGQKINGTILREKAREMAVESGQESFQASNGWLDKFKKRYGLKVCPGKELDFKNDNKTEEGWAEGFLENLLKKYIPEINED